MYRRPSLRKALQTLSGNCETDRPVAGGGLEGSKGPSILKILNIILVILSLLSPAQLHFSLNKQNTVFLGSFNCSVGFET